MVMTRTTTPLWARLRERRWELGRISTAEAAAMCGVAQPTYSRWENQRMPADEYLDVIASFLGVSRAEVVLLRAGEDPSVVTKVPELEARAAALEEQIRTLRLPSTNDAPPDT